MGLLKKLSEMVFQLFTKLVTKELENSNQIYQLSIKTNLAFIHEFMNCLLQVIKGKIHYYLKMAIKMN